MSVLVRKEMEKGINVGDLSSYLYKRFSDELIEVRKIEEQEDKMVVEISSEILSEETLGWFWDYVVNREYRER